MGRIEQLYDTFYQALTLAESTAQEIEQERVLIIAENIKRKIAKLRVDPNGFTGQDFLEAQVDIIRLKGLDADHSDLEDELLSLYSHVLKTRVGKAKKDNRAGFVYVICDYERTGDCKIGRARNWQDRIAQFEVKLPFKFSVVNIIRCQDMFKAESDLHARYRHQRTNGEWHALTDSQIDELKLIKAM